MQPVTAETLALIIKLIPIKTQPFKAIEYFVNKLLLGALLIRIFDP